MGWAHPLLLLPAIVTATNRSLGPTLTSVHGLSLVEVLVASSLLVTGVAALVHLFVIASRATVEARDTTVAAILAAQKMEELRSAAFPGGPAGEAVEYLSGFVRRSTIEPLPSDPVNAVVITVDVSRPSGPRVASRLITIRAREAP